MIGLVFSNVLRNKRRSFLTVLGILIGVAAIISLVSISLGIAERSTSMLSSFQSMYVMKSSSIMPSMSTLDISYQNKLKSIPGVKVVTPEIWGNAQNIGGVDTQSNQLARFIFVIGIDPVTSNNYDIAPYYTVMKGRKLTANDRKSVVIGSQIADQYNLFVGTTMMINGITYQVVGIYETKVKSPMFNVVIVTIDEARILFNFNDNTVTNFAVLPINPMGMRDLKDRINERYNGVLEAMNMQDASDATAGFLGSLNLALWVVSGIAGFVGGIGVMNTMLMSVMERIQEFGVLKAIGWRNRDVFVMIILEGFVLGIVGALIGIIFGNFVSNLAVSFTNIPSKIDIQLIGQATLFAVTLSLVGSSYPAYKASRMSPVEAVTKR
ncbi:MacB-like periplasmic core domain protein [Candidatus Tiddalikarchaeum anstoanum]|nr:MacB-like periplasmic core domain protein [Candidatus Tiddalikarchaeum anstoanum]